MKNVTLPLLAIILMAAPCFAQDSDSFVTHIKSPDEIEYDNWLKDHQQKAEAASDKNDSGSQSDDPDIDNFAKSYFYAYRNGDMGALRMLVAQDTLRCLDSGTNDYFRQELSQSSHTGKIETLKWKPVDTDNDDSGWVNSRSRSADEREIEISWREDAATVRHDVKLTQGNGRYYMDVPCNNAQQTHNSNWSDPSLGGYGSFGGNNGGNQPYGGNSLENNTGFPSLSRWR